MKTCQGRIDGTGLRVAVVASRFNGTVAERLLSGAIDALRQHGVAEDAIEVVRVPGAFELPLATQLLAARGDLDAIVALGALVRGETPHFDFIAGWVVAELGRQSVEYQLPIALGVLTTNTIEQGLARSGGNHGNKGAEAAVTALEMANLRRTLGHR